MALFVITAFWGFYLFGCSLHTILNTHKGTVQMSAGMFISQQDKIFKPAITY